MTNGALVTVLQVLALAVLTAVPGGALTAPDGWTPPRTADGHPDLQGVWANNSATPLERPTELADKATLTDEEVAVLAARAAELFAYNDERGGVDAAFGDGVFQAVIADPDEHTSTDGGPATTMPSGWSSAISTTAHRSSSIRRVDGSR